MHVTWIVQTNLHREEGHRRLVDALTRIGSRFIEVQVLPFVDTVIPAETTLAGQDIASIPSPLELLTGHVFAMGSYKLARILNGMGLNPGAYMENLRYPEWAKGWGHDTLLNPHAQVGPLSAVEVTRPSFVRPVADSKEFAGRVFNPKAFDRWRAEALRPGSQHVPPETVVLVAPVCRDLYTETRVWVVDGHVVTASPYRRGGRADTTGGVDPEVLDFAQHLANQWCPNPAFVVDVAQTDRGPVVVEANCLNACGFYNGDMQRLVAAVEAWFAPKQPSIRA